ncbi:hypothetical protein EYZ11_007260 [Aspergillus tanneri]|uniref:Rhodopsin domain-containing protein n=1 Tax=Aspergillus tanneri TaxID=1220188 RepID=A0A4V3UP12_9EURO|nr:hypothetical protein EYZ11_007260 [Aspergillus tanneri]
MAVTYNTTWITELWALFGIGTFIILMRLVFRWRMLGLRGLAGDDYTCIPILACHVVNATGAYLVAQYGNNADFDQDEINMMTDEQAARLIVGSKWEIALAFIYSALLWFLKANMLFLSWRLTRSLTWHNHLILWIAGIIFLSYLGVVLTIVFNCYPPYLYWQIKPLPPMRCIQAPVIFGVVFGLNVM